MAKRLPYTMSIFCNFFRHGKFRKLRILRKRASLKSSKSLQKQGIDLQPFQIFKTMRSVFYFKLGIGNSVRSFQRKFKVPRYLKIGNKRSLETHGISKEFNFPRNSKSSRILCRKAGVSLPLETRIF